MSVGSRPEIQSVRALLRDGTPVLVRAAREDDARFADAFFGELSDETRYLRFLYPVKELTPQMLTAALAQEGLQRVALVAQPLADEAEQDASLIGIARYAPTADPAVCELAVTVVDPWQGRGVGHVLLARLLELAAEGGYAQMVATALPSNVKMAGLARSFGFELRDEPVGVTTMRRRLPGATAGRTIPPR